MEKSWRINWSGWRRAGGLIGVGGMGAAGYVVVICSGSLWVMRFKGHLE